MIARYLPASVWKRLVLLMGIVGPGLITASAGNDAPGIATYSMAGSFYGLDLLWVLTAATLGAVVLLEMAARMGAATGMGLTAQLRERFGVRATFALVLGLGLANLGTTAAQFAGIAAGSELLGLPALVTVPIIAFAVWFLVARGSYGRVERVLLLLTTYAIAYVITALRISPPWELVVRKALVPSIRLEADYILAGLATVGTTVTPWACAYVQASVVDKGVKPSEYAYTRLDVIFGLVVSSLVSAFIVTAAAVTLHARGIEVDTAAKAALALEPLAGPWARYLFAFGLLGASTLAASVLPLATTYAICEAFGWERGVDRHTEEAPIFYGIFTGLIVLSATFVLIPGVPLFPLMWLSQVLNALILPALAILMIKMASDRKTMKRLVNGRLSNVAASAFTILVSAATIALLAQLLS